MTLDEHYMQRAIRLARRGAGYVEPNPMVGCVIVRNNRIVGEGWHKRFGGPHAEVNALRAAGRRARGATMYVTLEPCAHHGKTPPCTDAVRNAGIKRLVIGARDPYKTASGGGAALRRAGLKVDLGVCADDAQRLIAPYTKFVTRRMPFVIAKWAATLDGSLALPSEPRRVAAVPSRPRWISNESSRRLVHILRSRVDAVMVGIGTVLADDPALTARNVPRRRIARRVVIDPSFKLPLDSSLIATLAKAPLSVAVSPVVLKVLYSRDQRSRSSALKAKLRRAARLGVEFIPFAGKPDRHGQWRLAPVLRHLARRHHATNILVEGGPRLLAAMFAQGLVDRAMVFIAPKFLIGGGLPVLRVPDLAAKMGKIRRSQHLRLHRFRRVDNDLLLEYSVG